MIFVILGTQDKHFGRLLQEVEKLIQDGTIVQKVIVQAGTTPYQSDCMEIHSMIPKEQFLDYVKQSDYIITHGGVGTILDAMKENKKIIAVPRLKEYNEHENNHQLQIIEKFTKEQYLIGCMSVEDLKTAVDKIDKFEPKQCKLGNQKIENMIVNYIETTPPKKRKDTMIFAFYAIVSFLLQMLIYFIGYPSIPSTCMWIGWAISYIPLILFTYQKRNLPFEMTWGILLGISLLLWFDLYQGELGMMMLVTLIADVLTYIGHKMYYVRGVQ